MADFIMKLRSRKFLTALATAIFIILTDGLGLNVPQEIYDYIVKLAITYIAVEGAVDIGRSLGVKRGAA